MRSLKIGDPLLDSTDVGPRSSRRPTTSGSAGSSTRASPIPRLELVTGGTAECSAGYFVPPTLFTVEPAARTAPLSPRRSSGPCWSPRPSTTTTRPSRLANSLPVGLTASVWTTSLHTAMAAARDFAAGYVWVNWSSEHIAGSSFGGVKNSGLGREESLEEIESYTQHKNVYLRF